MTKPKVKPPKVKPPKVNPGGKGIPNTKIKPKPPKTKKDNFSAPDDWKPIGDYTGIGDGGKGKYPTTTNGKKKKKPWLTDEQRQNLKDFGALATDASKIAGEMANRHKEAGVGGGQESPLGSEGGKGLDFSEDPVISAEQPGYLKKKQQYGLA